MRPNEAVVSLNFNPLRCYRNVDKKTGKELTSCHEFKSDEHTKLEILFEIFLLGIQAMGIIYSYSCPMPVDFNIKLSYLSKFQVK